VSGDFWAAVEREDLASIVGTLGVPEEPLSAVLPALASWRRGRIEQSTLDGWRYRVGWKTVTAERGQTLHGTWLLLVPEGLDHPWIGAAADALRTAGATIVPVEVGDTDRAGLAALLSGAVGRKPAAGNAGAGNAAAGKTAGELRGVLSLLALEESPHPEYPVLPLGLAKTLLTVQALGDAGISVPLWLATAGAVAAGRADAVTSPKQAQTWGLGRVVGLEHADRWGGIVDLPPVPGKAAAQWFAAAMAGCGDEDQLAVRDSGLLARRLVRAPSRPGGPARDWRPAGTVLITGGTGGLGACVARWLAAKGATRLVLASRSGPQAAGVPALIAELGELGAVATAVRLDVADRASVRGLLAGLDEETPVSSVVHAAGLVQATTVADTSLAEVADVLAAKVAGAVNLDELLDRELDAFVLFSSNAGVWGSGGQGAYAAGNAFLDALAQQRRERGLAATSVAWGAWRGSGMAARDDAEHWTTTRRSWLSPMSTGRSSQRDSPRPAAGRSWPNCRKRGRLRPTTRRCPRTTPSSSRGRWPRCRRQSRNARYCNTCAAPSPPCSGTPARTRWTAAGRSRTSASTRSPPWNSATGSRPPRGFGSRPPWCSTIPRLPHSRASCAVS
jgi:NAD(P)-dependent dehydrogenase (short-subunit alcohol dehydrogenase family)